MTRVGRLALVLALGAVAVSTLNPASAQQQRKPKPITREWQCDNNRVVLVNYHPIRIREPAWLTYLGNRVEVQRKRVDRGVAARSADGRVEWQENGNSAELEFQGLLDQPLHCEAKPAAAGGKGQPAKQQ